MARDPEASPTSTPTSFSSAIESDATVIDATVPVLTPATSISEHSMSSGHEKSQNDRNGTKASRRVTRLSLKEAGWKDTNDNTNENTRLGDKAFAIDENPQEIVGQVPGSQEIRPILPPGSSAHTEAGDARSQVINDDSTQLNGEPASPSNDSDNAVMSTDEMSLTREDGTSTKGGNGAKRRRRQTDITKATCSRRSTRLSLLDKSQELAQTAPSTLGKRKLDAVPQGKDMGKIPNRRASLRPRIENQRDNVQSSTPVAPLSKKRRLSEGDGDVSKVVAQPEAPKRENSLIRQMKKTWLKHGLFAGQNYVDQSVLKTKKRKGKVNAAESQQSPVFPLPMYAGARLLEKGRDYKLPFDIFSPLPYRQPKPNEWRKANKNVFVGDAASIWKANKLTEHSTCTCTRETGCDENCHNRYMFYECDNTNCKLGPEFCRNRAFSELRRRSKARGKFNIGVEVIKTEDRGYGVRSNRSFDPNQIIVEYTGEILTQEECERRMRTVYKKSDCYYLMYFDQNMVIDATRGSIARFINHSCEPNCRMEKWTVAGKPRMALFAGDDGIITGEELTYDYNFDPYSQKNVQECRCGAPTCRGVLGPKSKDLSKSKDKEPKSTQLTVKDAGPKRKANKILDESTSQLNKKQRVSKSATLILGARKSGSKVRTTLQSVRSQVKVTAPEKTTKRRVMVKPTQVKKRGSAVGRVRIPSRNSSNSTPGRKKQVRVSNGRLNMPSKPRLGNSIAAARASIKTPAAMRKFLQLGSTATDTINSTTLLGTRTRRGKAYSAGDCVKAGNGAGEEPPVRRPRGRPKKNP